MGDSGALFYFIHWSRTRRKETMVKYVFVTGGVVSGLGKGITAASLEGF